MTFRALPYWFTAVLLVAPASAWGPEGHRLVAGIAEAHLNAKARAAVARLLEPGESLESVASWADHVRPQRPETAPYHFINLPITATGGDWRQFCTNGNCIVSAITGLRRKVAEPDLRRAERAEALKFLIHLTGDIHQPLHCGDNQDRGGNRVAVIFRDRATNLHSLWDTPLVLEAERRPGWKKRVTRNAGFFERRRLARGRPEDWAWQSQRISRELTYAALPASRPALLTEDYASQAAPAIELQIRRAGLRLAAVLNQALGR